MSVVDEYTTLEGITAGIESGLHSFMHHYKALCDRLAEINSDSALKTDVTTVASKGNLSFTAITSMKTKAKKVRDLMNTEFPEIVKRVEEA